MSAEHEQALSELSDFRDRALTLRARIYLLPTEPDQSAIAGGGFQRKVNAMPPRATDSRKPLEDALESVLSAIDSYLRSI